MQGDTEKKGKKRRKKKSKFGYYLYAVTILTLTIVNITLAALLITYVQRMDVSGNINVTKKEILTWVQEDSLTANSLYTLWKFKSGTYKMPVYLEKVDVKLKTPWDVKFEVTEKEIVGGILSEGFYVYFDSEGLVLKKTTEYDDKIPLIEGIRIEDTERHEQIRVDNKKVFSYVMHIAEGIQKYKLSPERIVWEENSMNLYFGEICAKLGKTNFDDKLLELSALLEKAEGKSGIFHLEHYTKDNTSISFEKNT